MNIFSTYKFSSTNEVLIVGFYSILIIAMLIASKTIKINAIKNAFLSFSIILIIRVILFYLPFSWLWQHHLVNNVNSIRGRPHGIAKLKHKTHLKDYSTKYLAFGDSQIGFMFENTALIDSFDFDAVSIPGLRMSEYAFFENNLIELNPEYLILYLTDRTIASVPEILPLGYRPVDLLKLKNIFFEYKASNIHTIIPLFRNIITGELIPEYKYAHLFKKGINHYYFENAQLDGWINSMNPPKEIEDYSSIDKKENYVDPNEKNLQKDDPALLQLIDKKGTKFNQSFVDFNIAQLEKFINNIVKKDIKIIILEGHYHPYAFNVNTKFTKLVPKMLKDMADTTENVFFIPRKRLIQLKASDYFDDAHLKRTASEKMFHKIKENVFALDSIQSQKKLIKGTEVDTFIM